MRSVPVRATLLLLTILALPAAGLASGTSRSTAVGPDPDPFLVTRVVKCHVLEIQPSGTVVVRDDRSNEVHELPLVPDTKIVAAKKADFDGRKKLDREDLAAGQALKVTIREADMEVLRIKILES